MKHLHHRRLSELEANRRPALVSLVYTEDRDTGGPTITHRVWVRTRPRQGDEPFVQRYAGLPPGGAA